MILIFLIARCLILLYALSRYFIKVLKPNDLFFGARIIFIVDIISKILTRLKV